MALVFISCRLGVCRPIILVAVLVMRVSVAIFYSEHVEEAVRTVK